MNFAMHRVAYNLFLLWLSILFISLLISKNFQRLPFFWTTTTFPVTSCALLSDDTLLNDNALQSDNEVLRIDEL